MKLNSQENKTYYHPNGQSSDQIVHIKREQHIPQPHLNQFHAPSAAAAYGKINQHQLWWLF